MATEVKQAFDDALAVLEKLGLETEEVTIPHMDLIPAVKVCTSRVEMPRLTIITRTRARL